jgi:hypothetical protein
MLKASIIGLLILLILIIIYQYCKISEGFIIGGPRITAFTKRNGIYVDIIAKTTDGSTIRGVNIVYNSGIPVLPAGGSTDSSIGLNLVVSPTEFPITNEPLNNMKDGYKYYFIQSPATKYTEGVTPLLGSFIYKRLAEESSTTGQQASLPSVTVTPPLAFPTAAPTAPTAVPEASTSSAVQLSPAAQAAISTVASQPTATLVTPSTLPASQETVIAKEKQEKSELLRDIQQIVRTELLGQQKMTTASSQPVLRAGSNEGILMSPAAAQGQEMSTARDKFCPKNMNEYIRKDSIPCWNCTLDY